MANQGPIERAVAAAMRGIPEKDPRDEAARALARKYAALIDAAAMPAGYRKAFGKLMIAVDAYESLNDEAIDAYHKIAAALSAHTVASDLGPKLLAVLTSLGLTTAARGIVEGGKPDGDDGSVVSAARDEVAQQRRKRAAAG